MCSTPTVNDSLVGHKTIRALSTQDKNYPTKWPKVLKNLDKIPDPRASCPCRRHYAKEYRPQESCILSGNLKLVKYKQLRKVLGFGPNFRDKITHQSHPLRTGRITSCSYAQSV